MGKKGQFSVEYIITVAIVFAVLALSLYYIFSYTRQAQEDVSLASVADMSNQIIKNTEEVHDQGFFGVRSLKFSAPEILYEIRAENNYELLFLDQDGNVLYAGRSNVPIKTAGLRDYSLSTLNIIKEENANFTLICAPEMCQAMFCPGGSVKKTYCPDADVDGYGDPKNAVESCSQPPGHILNCRDCDDSDETVCAFCAQASECPDDYYTTPEFCFEDNVYRTLRDYSCEFGCCRYADTDTLTEDCPDDAYVGGLFCSGDDVYRTWRDHYCDSGMCGFTDSDSLIQDCPDDEYVSAPFCSGDDVYRTWRDHYCDSGMCGFTDSDSLIQDCPDDEYVSAPFCSGGDVYRTRRDHYCDSGMCGFTDSNVRTENCGPCGCSGGSCVEPCCYTTESFVSGHRCDSHHVAYHIMGDDRDDEACADWCASQAPGHDLEEWCCQHNRRDNCNPSASYSCALYPGSGHHLSGTIPCANAASGECA